MLFHLLFRQGHPDFVRRLHGHKKLFGLAPYIEAAVSSGFELNAPGLCLSVLVYVWALGCLGFCLSVRIYAYLFVSGFPFRFVLFVFMFGYLRLCWLKIRFRLLNHTVNAFIQKYARYIEENVICAKRLGFDVMRLKDVKGEVDSTIVCWIVETWKDSNSEIDFCILNFCSMFVCFFRLFVSESSYD
jgi:hypothetical protein